MLVLLILTTQSGQAQTYSVLYTFTGGTDGAFPYAGLTRDRAGNLYGTTASGGTLGCGDYQTGCGVVFKLDPSGGYTVLHSFADGLDGYWPVAPLILDPAGNLYGTTRSGGDIYNCLGFRSCGTVFKLDSVGNETVLYRFTGGVDGYWPSAPLIRDSTGNLYGTTDLGGVMTCANGAGCGTIFKLDVAGSKTVLHAFDSFDGWGPGGLIRDAAGNLYGIASGGGTDVGGTLFKVDTSGNLTVLVNFDSEMAPVGKLVGDAVGHLYGTTMFSGGDAGPGVIFGVDLNTGGNRVLYSFAGGADGATPYAGLIRDAAGNLYGTTDAGGAYGAGTVFKVGPGGKESVLYSFTGGTDGEQPRAALGRDSAGNLYGTTYRGGAGYGVIFKIAQ
jgi:uncharacterized repeat protein (TIGR03803 family)